MFNLSRESISADNAVSLIENKEVDVLDVRTNAEHTIARIRGSRNIDVLGDSFSDAISKLDKNNSYLIHCGGERRAEVAYDIMREVGFGNIKIMQGGMRGWEEKGFPIEKN